MNGIFYMWRRSIKNYLVAAVKKPAALILYLLLIGLVVFSLMVSSGSSHVPAEKNIPGYAAVLVGVFGFIGVLHINTGLKQGAAIFTLPDVNFLFTAPIDPGKVLLAGIAKQAAIMVAASLFLLAQYPNMRNAAGLDGMALVGLFLSYIAIGIVGNIMAAALYAFCAGKEGRRKKVYNLLYGAAFVLLLLLGWFFLQERDVLAALLRVFGANAWNFVPILGWARGLAVAFAEHAYGSAALFAVLLVAGGYVCLRLLRRADMDYFEDVLLAAERAAQTKADAEQGNVERQWASGGRVRKGKEGLRGQGAWAITFRMLREQSRGRLGMLDSATLMAAAIPLFSLVFIGRDMVESIGLWPMYSFMVWLLIFMHLRSGFTRELLHYQLYLSPQGPLAKLLAILLPSVLKSLLDGAVFAAMLLALLGFDVFTCVFALLLYVSVSFLYDAGYLLVERLLGASRNKMLVMFMYILILILLCVPGMVGAMVLGAGWGAYAQYLVCMAWNIAAGLLVLLLCRGVLVRPELQ